MLFSTLQVTLPIQSYAISLDDDEEDAEDVADLLAEAKNAGKSESFDKADALLKKAKMYGVNRDDIQETTTYVAKKKQAKAERLERERKERERLARLKREKEERARQARLAEQSRSHRSRYITSLGYDAPSYDWDKYTVWYKLNISINDGSHIYARVTQAYSGDCYQLSVGSIDSSIFGGCSNCSKSINSYWSCHANGAGRFSVNGNPAEAANAIVQWSR